MPKYIIYAHKLISDVKDAGYSVFAELDGKPLLKLNRVEGHQPIKDLQKQLGSEFDCEVFITEEVPAPVGPPPESKWTAVVKGHDDVAKIHERVAEGMRPKPEANPSPTAPEKA